MSKLMGGVLLLLAFVGVAYLLIKGLNSIGAPKKVPPVAETEVRALITRHIRALATKRTQLTYRDAYGVPNTRRWDKEKERFYDGVVYPAVSAVHWQWPLVSTWIDEEVTRYESSPEYASSPLSRPVEAMSPLEYERYCAELLESLGWVARVTKGSGDQGADVIAEKDGLRVVLQCKKYGKPVGNKAVQEALAAMRYEDAHLAAVVSNATFTPAAVALAGKSGVALLHHSELDKLEEALVEQRKSASETV